MLKKIENDIVFYTGSVSFRIYDTLWRKYILPLYTKNKERKRKPTRAILPYEDDDYRMRFITLRQQATYYQAEQNTFIQIPIFELSTVLDKEYFNNIVLAAPMLIFSIIDYYDDGRIINSREDVERLVDKFGLIDTLTPVTDENAYQLNTAFDIMKKVDDDLKYFLEVSILNATFFLENISTFVNEFHTKDYYYQDCSSMNKQYKYDVYGLFLPYMDDGKKRLLLETIILIKGDNVYVFQNTYEHWEIIRNTYINWTRSMGSMYEHQLGSNVYVQATLFHMRQNVARNHPLSIMMEPFFEGVYYTNGVFTDFGISIANTQEEHVNRYMAHVELFDISNESMRDALRLIHIADGYKILNYEIALQENNVDDIYFEQKELLEKLYIIIKELVSSIINYYYLSDHELKRDPEIRDLYTSMEKDFPFLGDLSFKSNLINFFTNIIYLSSIRHSQSHINFAYLNDYYDYALRKTNFTMILNKLESGIEFQEADLFSTQTDFYSKYSSGMYPSVPLNLFGTNYKNLFTDREVQRFFKVMKGKFNDLKNETERNNYTEFLFRLQNSNTI